MRQKAALGETSAMDSQRARVLRLVREHGLDLAALSRGVGRNHAYFQQYLKRGTPKRLPEDVREALCARFGLAPEELSGGKPPPGRKGAPLVHFGGEEYGAVKSMAARLSAGAGAESDESEFGQMLFRMQWLRGVTSAGLDSLVVVPVDGDSMEPSLRTGDHALVDLTQRKPSRKDGLYVIRSDGGLQVKRVSAHPSTGKLAVRSDNPAYESYANVDPASVAILGRVIWIGRRV